MHVLDNLFLLTFWLFIAELAASVFWLPRFWTFGIPVFRSKRKIIPGADGLPSTADIGTAFPGGVFPRLMFRQVGEDRIAFRESFQPRFMALNYVPLMRGVVRFDRARSTVKVTGYVYWSILAVTALFIALVVETRSPETPAGSPGEVLLLGFFGVLLGLLYLIQAIRFRAVAKEVAMIMDADVTRMTGS